MPKGLLAPDELAANDSGPLGFGGAIGPFFPKRRAAQLTREIMQQRADTLGSVDVGVDELVNSTADPAYAAAFQKQLTGARKLATSLDPEFQKQGLQQLNDLAGSVRTALDKQKDGRDKLTMETLRDNRKAVDTLHKGMAEVQSNIDQMNSLLSDDAFDPNKPINRGQLISLMQSSTRQMLSDPADLADALGRMGQSGSLVGSLVGVISGVMRAEDFTFSKDDWRKLGGALYMAKSKSYISDVARIGKDTSALEQASAGLFPAGYSATQYVLGDLDQFKNPFGKKSNAERAAAANTETKTPVESVKNFFQQLGASQGSENPAGNAINKFFGGVYDKMPAKFLHHDAAEGETGAQYERRRMETGAEPIDLSGKAPDPMVAPLYDAYSKMPAGAQMFANPQNGRVFMRIPGTEGGVEVATNSWNELGFGGSRGWIKEQLSRRKKDKARGVGPPAPPAAPGADGTLEGVYIPKSMRKFYGGRQP